MLFLDPSEDNLYLESPTKSFLDKELKKNHHLVTLEGEEISLDETFTRYHIPNADSGEYNNYSTP